MTDMLRKLGVTFAYVPFLDEQHGFRNPKNIEHSLEAELFFYGQIFNFSPANLNTRVQIENIK
jgi:dipeptidyl aminopeptidase/acylaminoacyl peptidase